MRKRLQSILFALRGLRTVFIQEKNFRIHTIFGAVVLVAMFLFPLTSMERVVLVLVIALVMLLELTNTALEYTLDIFHPRIHPSVGVVKDVMAGTVLVAAVTALMVGILIFLPYVQELMDLYW